MADDDFTITLGSESNNYSFDKIFTNDGKPNIDSKYLKSDGSGNYAGDVTITMINNITLTSNVYTVILSNVTFNGRGRNLYLNGITGFTGAINCSGGTIHNLNVKKGNNDSTLANGSNGWFCKGSLSGLVQNCSVDLDFIIYRGLWNGTGGICYINNGIITNCHLTGNIGNYSGGICYVNNGTITDCYSTGSISNISGGICYYNNGTITNCYSTGNINDNSGGICAGNFGGIVENCHSIGNINNNSGGICYYNSGTIKNCYSTGSIDNDSKGISYYNEGIIIDCYSTDGANFKSVVIQDLIDLGINLVTTDPKRRAEFMIFALLLLIEKYPYKPARSLMDLSISIFDLYIGGSEKKLLYSLIERRSDFFS